MYSLYAVSSILVSALLECGSDSLPWVPRQCSGLRALGTYYPVMQRTSWKNKNLNYSTAKA